tara:strand:- start:2311 stop:3303 length:993 start_codon:yes stop_codon:yes gene_type:complete
LSTTQYDVLGIGNAIVDILVQVDDSFLASECLVKGAMDLVTAEQANELCSKVGPAIKRSGGSAANTIASLAALGGRGAFIGKVCDDELGIFFRNDINALGVSFNTSSKAEGPPTATSLVLISPDAERTMQTHLGASQELGPNDIDEKTVAAASVTYLEGYLWDPAMAKEAFLKAADIAHANGKDVALSLSDTFCVDRHRADFQRLISNYVDIVFANEAEICALYNARDFDMAIEQLRGRCRLAVLTRGANGSVIIAGEEVLVVDPEPVDLLVDTTGAGDAYAAGFFYGLSQSKNLATCAGIGSIIASEIIQHIGARPDRPLKGLVAPRIE